MKGFHVSLIGFSMFGLVAGLMTSGCSSQMAAAMRKVTYPPEFQYVEPAQLRSNMDHLAQHVRSLDLALHPSNSDLSPEQQQVIAALQSIERIADKLKAGEGGASHPFLQNDMSRFASQVTEARVAASLPQPSYYLAGKVAGGCVNCHKINR